jgi:acyl-CoA thioesterase
MIDDITDRIGMSMDGLAEACAREIAHRDCASATLGIERIACGVGSSVVAMTVGPEMINGHGIAHGGFIFALADCAASLVANSYNERAVAATTSITFLASCRLGDRLIASASEVVRRQRTGIYDVSVSRGGEVVAEFRATTRATGIAVLAAR